jgi:predicted phage-related endonuclease
MTMNPQFTLPDDDRQDYIGASDAGTVAAVNPWKSWYTLYQEKIGATNQDPTESMMWGTLLESSVISGIKELHGVEILTPRKEDGSQSLFINRDFKEIPLGCHLDGYHFNGPFKEDLWIDEIKCSSSYNKGWGTQDTDDLPPMYLMQGVQQIKILEDNGLQPYGVQFWVFQDMKLKHYILKNDSQIDSIWDAYLHKAKEFWRCVRMRTPPEPLLENEFRDAYPTENGIEVEANSDVLEILEEISFAKSNVTFWKEKESEQRKKLMNKLGNNEAFVYQGKRCVSWKTQTTSRFQQKEFKLEQPELYNQYLKTSESRVLRVNLNGTSNEED